MVEQDAAERQLRTEVKASEGRQVAPAARQIMTLVRDVGIQQGALRAGAMPGDLQRFSRIFAQGIQWAKEHYPDQEGPKMVVFGHKGTTINVAGMQHRVEKISEAEPLSTPNGLVFVMVPFEDIVDLMAYERRKEQVGYKADNRRSLGAMAPEELIFIAGVEEAYHSVQYQDPALRKKYDLNNPNRAPERSDYNSPREIDVVPVKQHALNEFRRRRAEEANKQHG